MDNLRVLKRERGLKMDAGSIEDNHKFWESVTTQLYHL